MRRLVAAIGLCLSLSAAAHAQGHGCARPTGSPALRDEFWRHPSPVHPLMGRVYRGDEPIAIDAGTCIRSPLQQLIVAVWETIRGGGIVLLGEVHDNPEQHSVRGDILWPRIDRISTMGELRPAAVFEHIRTSQQPQLDRFYQLAGRSRGLWGAEDLLRELGWETSGWPPSRMFEPLFGGALWARMPIHPGNAPRERVRALARGDATDLTPGETAMLGSARAMPEPLLAALAQELEASHCGMVPASATGVMSLAQRYTDAHMAGSLVAAADKHGGAFLLAGNGHVRTDRGVPWHLRRMASARTVVTVMLLEVVEGKEDAQSYLPRDSAGRPAADFVLFTPRQARPDPCLAMRRGRQ